MHGVVALAVRGEQTCFGSSVQQGDARVAVQLNHRLDRFANVEGAHPAENVHVDETLEQGQKRHDAQLTFAGPEGPVTRSVAGDLGDPILDGIIGSPEALAPFKNLPLGTTVLIKAKPGVDPRALAGQIHQALLADGAEVTAIADLFRQRDVAFQLFASVPVLFMRMGIVIGILSLAILALRAAVQRRRSIGVLRALGYRRGEVVAGVVTEAALTTTCGVLVGIVTGIATTYLYLNGTITATPFGFDVWSLAGTVALMYAAVLLATFGPALAAARTPPAQALRLQE